MSRESQSSWFVYIVQCSDASLYTGITVDLEQRLLRHNQGEGARYTRARLPVRLVYSETAADRAAASRREWQIKRLSAAEKRALIS